MHNYKLVLDVRSSRFSLTASLKSIQVAQSITLLHNTVYAISTRAILQSALRRYQLGNNTLDNWSRTIEDLQNSASASTGGFAEVLQMVVFDENLSNGAPGVPYGTELDGTVVGSSNYTGFLPNGTRLNVGNGLGGRIGLLNSTGDNAAGIILPPSATNGYVGGPMLMKDQSFQQLSEAAYNASHGIPFHDGFPNALYPFTDGKVTADSAQYFTADYILGNNGLILGPMMVNDSFYMLSFTMPIINNTSESALLGFLTVVLNAQIVLDIIKDTRGLGETGQTILVGPSMVSNIWNDSVLSTKTLDTADAEASGGARSTHAIRKRSYSTVTALSGLFGRSLGLEKRSDEGTDIGDYEFRYLLPPGREEGLVGQVRKLKDYHVVKKVFEYGVGGPKGAGDDGDGGGSDLDTWNSEGRRVSVGCVLILQNDYDMF